MYFIKDPDLRKKLRHPAFWIVALARIVSGFYFFVNPWVAWIVWIILDYLDSTPWRYLAGLTSQEYEYVDKQIDFIVYLFMLASSLYNKYFLLLAALLLFRMVGQYIFDKKKDERILLLFPNLFEVFWLWLVAFPTINIPQSLGFFRDISGLGLLIVLKLIQEVYKHYLGPLYIFPKSTKFMLRVKRYLYKKMKIAFTCPYDMSHPGGVAEIVINVSKDLRKRGIETKVITIKPESPVDLDNTTYFGTSIPIQSNGSTTGIDISDFSTDLKLADYLEKERFDYICVQEPGAPFLNWEVLAHSKSKNIGWFHSTTFIDLDAFPYSLITFPLETFLSGSLRGLIAASPSVVKTWDKIFDDKNKLVLPAGTDINKFDKVQKLNLGPQVNILFVGRLDSRKGVFDAIKAFKIISDKINSKLWIIGKGEQKEQAFQLVNELKLQKKVEFLGFVKDEDLPAYYKSADIYLAPSLGGESVGIVLLDAMAAGVPVVAYSNVGYKFTLTGAPWDGSLVKIGNYKNMAESTLELLGDNGLRKKVIAWQKEKVKAFDWKVVTDKFLDYLKTI